MLYSPAKFVFLIARIITHRDNFEEMAYAIVELVEMVVPESKVLVLLPLSGGMLKVVLNSGDKILNHSLEQCFSYESGEVFTHKLEGCKLYHIPDYKKGLYFEEFFCVPVKIKGKTSFVIKVGFEKGKSNWDSLDFLLKFSKLLGLLLNA